MNDDWITALAGGIGAALGRDVFTAMTDAERLAYQQQLAMQQANQQYQQSQLANAAYNQQLAQQLMSAPYMGAGQQLLGSMLGSAPTPMQRDTRLEQSVLAALASAPRERLRPSASEVNTTAPPAPRPVHLVTQKTTHKRRVKLRSKEAP